MQVVRSCTLLLRDPHVPSILTWGAGRANEYLPGQAALGVFAMRLRQPEPAILQRVRTTCQPHEMNVFLTSAPKSQTVKLSYLSHGGRAQTISIRWNWMLVIR